ncbi:MAG: RNA-binding domain-containing protein [Methanomassiliicoccales archaeon]
MKNGSSSHKQGKPRGRVNRITCTAFCYSTESREKVKEAMTLLAGAEVEITEKKVESHFGNSMSLMEADMGLEALRSAVLKLSVEEKEALVSTLRERTDENGVLHIRFDKQGLCEGKFMLSSQLPLAERKERDSVEVEVHLTRYGSKTFDITQFMSQILFDEAEGDIEMQG